jgi:hypothetical protein
MNKNDIIQIVYLLIGNIGVYSLIIIFGLKIVNIFKNKYELDVKKYTDERNLVTMSPARTKEFHEFLKFLITETAVIEFQKYQMNTDITKVNRSGVQRLISDIATKIFESLTKDTNLFDDNNLLTKSYYMQYITNITIVTVNKLVDTAVEDIIE